MPNEQLKGAILVELKTMLETGEITRDEILQTIGMSEMSPRAPAAIMEESTPMRGGGSLATKILYLIGGTIALAGIAFFIGQIWEDIGAFARVMVTLGLGLLITGVGTVFDRDKTSTGVGVAFQIIGGLLIPGGSVVALIELEKMGVLRIVDSWPFAIASAMIVSSYAMLTMVRKNSVLIFFLIVNGTAFVYLFADAVLPRAVYANYPNIFENLTITIGLSYLLLAHVFRDGEHRKLIGILNFFGILGVLLVTFTKMFDSGLWELLFLPLAMSGIAYAVFTRTTSSLVVSSLFLMAYFVYITSEYFADSIGWPLALVIIGFVIIGLGYFSIHLRRKYIST